MANEREVKMTFYKISEFYYDSDTKNIRIQFALPLDETPEYETLPGDIPTETFEAEIFLDAGTNKIGEYHPGSVDGNVAPSILGRTLGQDPSVVPENPWPPA